MRWFIRSNRRCAAERQRLRQRRPPGAAADDTDRTNLQGPLPVPRFRSLARQFDAFAGPKFPFEASSGLDPGARPRRGGRNASVDFKGEKRSNETHASTTNPEARLYRLTRKTLSC